MPAANQAILGGHAKEGLQKLAALFVRLDPNREPDAFWSTGTILADSVGQEQSYAEASQIIGRLLTADIAKSNRAYFETMQFLLVAILLTPEELQTAKKYYALSPKVMRGWFMTRCSEPAHGCFPSLSSIATM